MEVVTEIAGDWTNRVKNLQKVKAAMDQFCAGVDGRVPKFDVDLVAIAISQDIHQLCNLLEQVLFCVLYSPAKDFIISRILRLSQSSQVALMHFIKQVTQEGDATEFVMTPTREIKQLRKAQAKLSSHLANVQNEYEFVWKEKERIEQEFTEMKLTNTDLESKLVSTVGKQSLTPDTIILDLEGKLSEKEQNIQRLKEELAELKKTHENSVNMYRDELDLTNSKLESLTKLEQSAQVMKLTVEELKPLKEQLRLSMEENENLHRKVDQLSEEESTFQSTSKQLSQLKESLTAEKAKKHQLETELLQKESHVKSLLKDNLELVEKIQFLESKNRELTLRLDQFLVESNAEDSFAVGTPIRELGENSVFRYDNPTLMTEEDPKVVRALDFWASDKSLKGMKEAVTLANENRELKAERDILTEEIVNLRKQRDIERVTTEAEMSSMRDTFRREVQTLQETIAESDTSTRGSLRDLTEQITVLTANVKAAEMINASLVEEVTALKAERETLWDETAQIYKEKDEMSGRFVASRDETLRLNTEFAENTV